MVVDEGDGWRGKVGNKGLNEKLGGDCSMHFRPETVFYGSVDRE